MHTKMTDITIPSVVVTKIEYGAQYSNNYTDNRQKFKKIIKNFSIISFTDKKSTVCGNSRQELTSKGKKTIGPNDLLITATVLSTDDSLITHNTDEFNMISKLKIEDCPK